MRGGPEALVEAVRAALIPLAQPERAEGMRAYMKSAMPFWGVASTPRRQACWALYDAWGFAQVEELHAGALALWRTATHREQRYAAIDLLERTRLARMLGPGSVPVVEEMVVSGAWWDLVDPLCTHVLGDLLRRYREPLTPVMRAWAVDAHLWRRRSAILVQNQHKAQTDWELLTLAIDTSLDSKEFFLRKAIGWALREHAKTAPERVREFVAAREGRMSGLSRREALKNIG